MTPEQRKKLAAIAAIYGLAADDVAGVVSSIWDEFGEAAKAADAATLSQRELDMCAELKVSPVAYAALRRSQRSTAGGARR